MPANAPVSQINANSVGLVTSADESFASVVLAGSDFSTTEHKYHVELADPFLGSGRGERSAAQSPSHAAAPAFVGAKRIDLLLNINTVPELGEHETTASRYRP